MIFYFVSAYFLFTINFLLKVKFRLVKKIVSSTESPFDCIIETFLFWIRTSFENRSSLSNCISYTLFNNRPTQFRLGTLTHSILNNLSFSFWFD